MNNCKGCEFFLVREETPYSDRERYCTNFPHKKKRQIKKFVMVGTPKWCPKIKQVATE